MAVEDKKEETLTRNRCLSARFCSRREEKERSRGDARVPLFSVVVPTYNRWDKLARLLKSISETSFSRHQYEVIIVDDGGSGQLGSVMQSFFDQLDITLIRLEHSGPASARNHGCSVARGAYLLFIDDDCTVPADWFETLSAQFARTPTSVVTGRTANTLAGNMLSATSQALIEYLYEYFNSDRRSARFFTSNNVAIPASVFGEVGGFDADFLHAAGEDRELCDRLLHGNYSIVYNPHVVVFHSHDLTLCDFVGQHFTYGRAAFLFHRKRAARNANGVPLEPLQFYTNMARYPLLRGMGMRTLPVTFLLVVTQVVNAMGMAWECIRRRELP